MIVENHVNLLFSSCTYNIDRIIIDPGDSLNQFYSASKVLLTHAHFDHIYGLNELLKKSSSAKVYTNEFGKQMLLNARKNMSYYHETPFVFEYPESIVIIEDGDEIELGNGQIAKVVFTPGHNPSCITWIIGDAIFTGDSYIPGIKTVTNLPGGNKTQAIESENLIKHLAIGKTIYPGHNTKESCI